MIFRSTSQFICYKHFTRKLVRFCSSKAVPSSSKVISDDGFTEIHNWKVGTTVHGFKIKDIESINDFNITAIRLIHDKTKAEYLHLLRNDSNNVFSINFRTTPRDSTGLPHILEHTVLCGSKLYPVRDPFFKMLNRSLATFMNAMTGSDYTMYPFSTQNLTDYQNLQKIYLDAVFQPNLKQLDFMQEGWRLENANPNDKTSDLVIKGIVYNEMKGAFSENDHILAQTLQNLILPDHTYGVISGGDPIKIPSLTWEDLKKFHKDHYHPSNAKFYSYGNFPLSPTLEFINGEYLSQFDYQEPKHTVVPPQKRWVEAKQIQINGRFENMREPFEKQNVLSISLLMSDVTDTYDTCLLQFLTTLLIKGPNAPFYKSMIEPNFSGGFTQCTGYDTQQRDSIFTVGLQGLNKTDFDKVIYLFNKTIDNVVTTGFSETHIESVLHGYELAIKHETSNFGLSMLFALTSTWNHDGNMLNLLKLSQFLDTVRGALKSDKKYLQNMVQKYFRDNKHRLVLKMTPDMEYEKKQSNLEKDVIHEKTKNLSYDDKQKIYSTGLDLLKQQNAAQDTNLLPTLQIGDISNDVERVHRDKLWCGPVPTQIFKVNTNGITYFTGVINTSELTPEQRMLLPLFCNIITKLGTNKRNYRDFDNMVNLKTAGLQLNVHLAESLYQVHSYELGVSLSSYCLNKNVDSMWELWSDLFNFVELKDVARFSMLAQLYLSNLTQGIADAGHMYAMQSAAGLVSGAAYQKDLLTGLQHISYMKRLVHTSSYEAMLRELTNMAKMLFDKNKLRCALNIADDKKDWLYRSYSKFINGLPGNTFGKPNERSYCSTKVWTPTDATNCHHHVLNVPVNYCSKAILTVPYTDPDYAKLRVLGRLLSSKYLHPEIREKQGAYGGGAKINYDSVLTMYSYRDPRNLPTLDVFDNAFNWLQKELDRVTAQEILEAKLGIFQSVDAPVSPGNKGMNEFLRGIGPDTLQRHRAELMAVDRDGIRSVGEKYLGNVDTLSSKVILGPKNKNLNTSKRPGELWTVVDNE